MRHTESLLVLPEDGMVQESLDGGGGHRERFLLPAGLVGLAVEMDQAVQQAALVGATEVDAALDGPTTWLCGG